MRLSWLLLLSLAACSPYSFSKETAAISTGVDQVSNAFATGYENLAADEADQVQLTLTKDRAEAAMAPSCGKLSAKDQPPCVIYAASTSPPEPSVVDMTRPKTVVVLGALQDYSHGLAAVTNAADRTAYDAAVAQLSASVGEVAAAADAVAPGASVAAPAAVSFVGWIIGTALDQQRFDSLKAAVNAVGTPGSDGIEPIQAVTDTLAKGLQTINAARQQILLEEAGAYASQLSHALSDADYKQKLSSAQAKLAVLNGLRQSDPTGMAHALVSAHDELVAAVNDPRRSFASLLKALNEFRTKAAALQAAFAAESAAQTPATSPTGK